MMEMNVIGRVKNTHLPKSDGLLPMFEAVVNSLHAIEEAGEPKGRIEIRVDRDMRQDEMFEGKTLHPIVGFTLTDNGIGFTDDHFKSFQTADSQQKARIGGKGIGRFLWLKAFEAVRVASIFTIGRQTFSRTFVFRLDENPVQGHAKTETQSTPNRTVVTLEGLRDDYRAAIPRGGDTIATRLMQHCLRYLIHGKAPMIGLFDPDEDAPIDIGELFKAQVSDQHERSLSLKGQDFTVDCIRLASPKPIHEIYLCAHNRHVTSDRLQIPDIKDRYIQDSAGRNTVLIASVSGAYLDTIVNAERTHFNFARPPEDGATPSMVDIPKPELINAVTDVVREELRPELDRLDTEKMEQVQRFIQRDNPKYRALLTHAPQQVRAIPAGLTDEKLDIELHRVWSEAVLRNKEEGRRYFTEEPSYLDSDPNAQEEFNRYIAKLTEFTKGELAEYVVQRKVLLAAFERALGRTPDGKRINEDRVHTLLHPMRTTSDKADYSRQNLWILDERLTYHTFLASDLAFAQMERVASESDRRPDLLIFDRPSAYADSSDAPESVVIIELKKPERNEYADDDSNPITQVYQYIDELKAEKIEDGTGKVIRLRPDTRFYCYIIASLTARMRKLAERAGLHATPDRAGYYFYNGEYRAWVEVLGYEKVVEDAKKRNRAFFDKLGLTH